MAGVAVVVGKPSEVSSSPEEMPAPRLVFDT